MELKTYLRILLKKWWLILLAFLVTFLTTAGLTFREKPVYQAIATFVISPTANSEDNRGFVSGLNVLSTQSEIATTYTEIAKSREIKNLAADKMKLSPEARSRLSVASRLRAGTNVLEITVQGNDPQLVQDFANAVGRQTVAYVQKLYVAFELKFLDKAAAPHSPLKPNRTLNLILGAVFGVILGMGLAFLADYLQAPPKEQPLFEKLGLRAEDIAYLTATRYPTSRIKPRQARLSSSMWFVPMMSVTGLLAVTTLAVALWQARRRPWG